MVDKNHNRPKPLEQLLDWNELFVDCLFYLIVVDFIDFIVIYFIVNVENKIDSFCDLTTRLRDK